MNPIVPLQKTNEDDRSRQKHHILLVLFLKPQKMEYLPE